MFTVRHSRPINHASANGAMEDIQRSADMALKFRKITLIVNARFSFDLPAQNLVVALREYGN